MLIGPEASGSGAGFFTITLNENGSIAIGDHTFANKDKYHFRTQLVYMDNRESVNNIYLGLPIEVTGAFWDWTDPDNTPAEKYGFVGVDPVALEKQFYLKNSITTNASTGEYDRPFSYAPSTREFIIDGEKLLGVIPPYYRDNSLEPARWTKAFFFSVVRNEQNAKFKIRRYGTAGGVSTFLQPDVRFPFTPYYSAPEIEGHDNINDIGVSYTINEAVYSAYPNAYPEEGLLFVIEDEKSVYKELASSDFKIYDKNNYNITNKFNVFIPNKSMALISISKEPLKSLANNTIRIEFKGTDYDKNKLEERYDSASNRYELPLKVSARWKSGNQYYEETSMNNAIQGGGPFGEVKSGIGIHLGSTTETLDANEFVTNAKSLLEGDQVSASFDQYMEFNEPGEKEVAVTLTSMLDPNRKKRMKVKVNVLNKTVSRSDFDNQNWLIDEIDRQLAPKAIDKKTVFQSDLLAITAINLNSESTSFPNQFIPKNIDWLANLQTLQVKEKKLEGELPVTIGNLLKLKEVDISKNYFRGAIPAGLSRLTKLNKLLLNENQFVGRIPEFKHGISELVIHDNQVTYNAKEAPEFLTGNYEMTFIGQKQQNNLRLVGNSIVRIDQDKTEIRPFDPTSSGYFNLHAEQKNKETPIDLYAQHTFEIKNVMTDEVLYTGYATKDVVLSVNVNDKLKVVMDGAEQNDNNSFQLTIKKMISKLVVNFVIEGQEQISEPLVFEGEVGSFLNLKEDKQLKKVIKDIEAQHYQLVKAPENEEAIQLLHEDRTIEYEFKGMLFVQSSPNFLNFGRKSLGIPFIKVEKAKYDKPLIVWDNRKNGGAWNLTATLKKPLTSQEDSSKTLPSAIHYKVSDEKTVVLSENEPQSVAERTHEVNGQYNVSNEWDKNESGLFLEVPSGEVLQAGSYRATILWQVEQTP
ncbi:hypothetical protein RV06_GL001599 [Enterococcus haemoperoxidus]|nr:hypothetical protein RV06_GL001599 [Enterococcus haemoperoxidus]